MIPSVSNSSNCGKSFSDEPPCQNQDNHITQGMSNNNNWNQTNQNRGRGRKGYNYRHFNKKQKVVHGNNYNYEQTDDFSSRDQQYSQGPVPQFTGHQTPYPTQESTIVGQQPFLRVSNPPVAIFH